MTASWTPNTSPRGIGKSLLRFAGATLPFGDVDEGKQATVGNEERCEREEEQELRMLFDVAHNPWSLNRSPEHAKCSVRHPA